MIGKKGISPLIATVLVIGFTIVLAALVLQWGGGLFEKIKGETAITSEVNLLCSTGLSNLVYKNPVYSDTLKTLKFTIDNANEAEVSGFLFRLTDKTSGEVDTNITSLPLEAFEVKQISLVGTDFAASGVDIEADEKLGIMARVTATDGSIHTCTYERFITIPAAPAAP